MTCSIAFLDNAIQLLLYQHGNSLEKGVFHARNPILSGRFKALGADTNGRVAEL